jgi:hypothetical protein
MRVFQATGLEKLILSRTLEAIQEREEKKERKTSPYSIYRA